MLLTDAAGRCHIGPPIHFHHEPAKPSLYEPLLGEHTAEVLASTGRPAVTQRAVGEI
jgi:hypothetical protein